MSVGAGSRGLVGKGPHRKRLAGPEVGPHDVTHCVSFGVHKEN